MLRAMTMTAAVAALAALSGCVEKDSKAEADKAGQPPSPRISAPKDDGLMKKVFSPPAPSSPRDDPRVINAKSASEAIAAALGTVRNRVKALRSKLDAKAADDDMKAVVEELNVMTAEARSDCDAVLRAAEDVRSELRYARDAYDDAAGAYRTHSRGYKERLYRQAEEMTAEQLEQLAKDTPRRIRETDRFIDTVKETRDFLAETSRSLRSIEAAVAILSVAPDAPRPSPKAERVRSHLAQFLDAIEGFQRDVLKAPWAKGQEPAVSPAPEKAESESPPEPRKKTPSAEPEQKPLGPTPAPSPEIPEASPTPPPAPPEVSVVGSQHIAAAPAPPPSWNARPAAYGAPLAPCPRCGRVHAASPPPTVVTRTLFR